MNREIENIMMPMKPVSKEDYYLEQGLMVMTRYYHLKRGSCCGSGCRHCPFSPRHLKGNTVVDSETDMDRQEKRRSVRGIGRI